MGSANPFPDRNKNQFSSIGQNSVCLFQGKSNVFAEGLLVSKRTITVSSNAESSFRKLHIQVFHKRINANFVLPYICKFLLYLCHKILVNVKLDVSGYQSIIFQGCRLYLSSSLLMAQFTQNWQ